MGGSKELLNLFLKKKKAQIPPLHQVIMVKIQAVERMKVGSMLNKRSSCKLLSKGVDHDDLMGAEESGEEDKKEVCIQVKLGKEEKTKPSLDR